MHQYHLGQNEEEKEGELVVSKIFYQTQPRQCNWSDRSATTGEGSSDPPNSGRRDSGSGSCSSSREIIPQRDDVSPAGVAPISAYSTHAMDIQHFKSDHFSFAPFRKSFDEVGIGEASTAREAAAASGTCEEMRDHQRPHPMAHEQQHHQQHQHPHHQIATATAFHISRPSHPISTIISPPPLHHTSIILDQDSYHVSRIMLQNENFQQQQQQQQQQHHKLGARSASGLEELIMGCTSSTNVKEESSIPNPQEAEWLKYSSFWPDPDNPDHHG